MWFSKQAPDRPLRHQSFPGPPRVNVSIAVDLDLEALLEARRRDPALVLVVADLCNLPFRDESLDLVWNSSTVEHVPDLLCALTEMARVTRTGGRVFVGVPNAHGPLGFQRWIANTGVGIWIGTVFTCAELERWLQRAGLNRVDALCYFFRFFIGILAEKPCDNFSFPYHKNPKRVGE